jgi:hypothetical protein
MKMTWMMITNLSGGGVFRRHVDPSDSLLRDFSALVPEGQYIQIIIENYGDRNEVLKELNRVDIVPYKQSPTFKLDMPIEFRGDDWHFPLTVHFYMDNGFIAKVSIPDLQALYKFGESYGKSFYVDYVAYDGTEVEFTFVPGGSRKVHKLVQRLY